MRISAAGATTGTAAGTATPARPRLGRVLARVRAEAAAPTAFGHLDGGERLQVVDALSLVLAGCYAHLPAKRAAYASDPVQALTLLGRRAAELSDAEFHLQLTGIVTGLRDAHTRYVGPTAMAGCVAVLPFLVEQYGDGGRAPVPGQQGQRRGGRRPRLHRRLPPGVLERRAVRARGRGVRRPRDRRSPGRPASPGAGVAHVPGAPVRPAARRGLGRRRLPHPARRPPRDPPALARGRTAARPPAARGRARAERSGSPATPPPRRYGGPRSSSSPTTRGRPSTTRPRRGAGRTSSPPRCRTS